LFASALDGSEWPASRSGNFTLTERAFRAHWVGAGVGLWTGITQYFLTVTNLFRQEQAVSSSTFELGTLKTQGRTKHYVYRCIVVSVGVAVVDIIMTE
jgi:hypothetical protein